MPEPIEEPIETPVETFKPIAVGNVDVEKADETPIKLDNNNFALISVLNKLSDSIQSLREAITMK